MIWQRETKENCEGKKAMETEYDKKLQRRSRRNVPRPIIKYLKIKNKRLIQFY